MQWKKKKDEIGKGEGGVENTDEEKIWRELWK